MVKMAEDQKDGCIAPTDENKTVLEPVERQRYSRHLVLPEVGLEGQLKLKAGRVLIVGAGGLGSPLALYLAAAGVGTLGIVDFDVVDLSNLQRQILHSTASVGISKLDSAKDRLLALNPLLDIRLHPVKLASSNAIEIFRNYDIIADGTDNFPARYLVNDACVFTGKPNVYGSVFRFEGQTSVFNTPGGPCYRCLYPNPPAPGLIQNCAEGGVLGVLPGLIGVIQATETVKLLMGIGRSLAGRLLVYDALELSFRELKLRKNPDCPVCGKNPSIISLDDYEGACGRQTMPLSQAGPLLEIGPGDLKKWMDEKRKLLLLDVREEMEWRIGRIHGARWIPLGQLEQRYAELGRPECLVVYCKAGMRSALAAKLLINIGFNPVFNLTGGILAWSEKIDPSIPIL
jgi:sulfur-carrier protein adenylyltransferase/sulfurtransferase